MTRGEVLRRAEACVCRGRDAAYGPPEDNFRTIAALWRAYLRARGTLEINGRDVALMMALLKIARAARDSKGIDNYVDLAGYASCAGELSCYKSAK